MQGLVVLRELTSAGYGCVLITNRHLGSGQTLHSHGLLNSGTGLMTGALRPELYEATLPFLRQLGVPVYGDDRSFLLLPDPVVSQLAPAWEANGYHPRRADAGALPAGLEAVAPVYRVEGLNVDKRRLVAALSAGLEHLVLAGQVMDAGDTIRVRPEPAGEPVSVQARAVVVAAGCGSVRLLRDAFGVEAAPGRVTYRKVHMICVRGPATALPDVGTVVAPEVMIVGHPDGGRGVSGDQRVTWYVTPADPAPTTYTDAPDDGVASVEEAAVRSGIEALERLVPALAREERIQATVFAGYKQDFDGQATQPACEVVDDERNVVLALPSVFANAVPNAHQVRDLVGRRIRRPSGTRSPHWRGGARVGDLNEDHGVWTPWTEFGRVHGVRTG